LKKTALNLSTEKANGRTYTPAFLVANILDLCDYNGAKILGKHIIDNSCGDGAFLTEVARRYCEVAKSENFSAMQIAADLSNFVHGIEIDAEECEKCRANLLKAVADFGITDVNFDIICADALTIKKYNGKMDYVVGNPPYVRVHNLLDSYNLVKEFSFAKNGMTDLYIVFYEIGLEMLNSTGILGYISPSSLFNSVAASALRNHLVNGCHIKKVVDLKHFQPFEATTYTAITILASQKNDFVDYYEYDKSNSIPLAVSRLNYEDFAMNGIFAFGEKSVLVELQKMMLSSVKTSVCVVKNGFATLCDNFFIGDLPFEAYTIPIVKASTGNIAKCFFPYDNCGKHIPLEILTKNPTIKAYYDTYAEQLKKRSLENEKLWHGFGRSQGINDINKKKYAINALVRNVDDIKLRLCDEGTGIYSGLYILTELKIDELRNVLLTDDFITYVAMLGKYKSGGYYTYSSKDLSRYLNYKFAERNNFKYEQLTFS
jgi:adenine-specific DNA-methyltransferase